MTPEIRSMHQQDIDRVYAIEQATHRAPWSRDILSDCILVGYDCRVLELVRNRSRKIVGYIICRYSLNVCHILNLCIVSTEQKRGYAKMLLRSLLESIKQTKVVNTIVLEVRPSNASAIALYMKFGFKKDSIKEAYYQDGSGQEDAIILKKTID